MPRISVVMPVYNTNEAFLREAIESVLDQTYDDFELLIVDDCSTNDASLVVGSYDDKRVKFIKQSSNKGAAAARNVALNEAKGEFIAFLDSDDVALKNRFYKQVDFLDKHLDVGVVGSSYIKIPKNRVCQQISKNEEIKACMVFSGCPFCQSSVMLRKKVLDDNNIRYREDAIPAEDYAMWLDLVTCTKFANLKEPLAKYRWHENNLSVTQADKQNEMCRNLQVNKWKELFNIDMSQITLIKDFIGFNNVSKDKFRYIEDFFGKLVSLSDKSNLFDKKEVRGFLTQLYKKILRRCKDKDMLRFMLNNNLNNVIKVDLMFKTKFFIKSIFLK